MKAVTYHGKRDVRVEDVPDPTVEQPTDAIIRVTSSGICGSDLHLYEVMGAFMDEGDILGHEPMGIVEAVNDSVQRLFETLCGPERIAVYFLEVYGKSIDRKSTRLNSSHRSLSRMPSSA